MDYGVLFFKPKQILSDNLFVKQVHTFPVYMNPLVSDWIETNLSWVQKVYLSVKIQKKKSTIIYRQQTFE